MRLGLSSEAAPAADLQTLAESCARRGLVALELVAGHGHGVAPAMSPAAARAAAGLLREHGVDRVLYRAASVEEALSPAAAELSAALDAAVVATAASDPAATESLLPGLQDFLVAGGHLLLAHGSDPAAVAAARQLAGHGPADAGVALAWDVLSGERGLGTAAPRVLDAAGPLLRSVRLPGSGPESAGAEGAGIGSLLTQLALRAYDGVIIVAPSAPETLPVWRLWLGRRAGWGCGSKAGDPALITIE
jgi:hypothetical protein